MFEAQVPVHTTAWGPSQYIAVFEAQVPVHTTAWGPSQYIAMFEAQVPVHSSAWGPSTSFTTKKYNKIGLRQFQNRFYEYFHSDLS